MATNFNIAATVIAEAEHLGEETEGLFIPDIVRMIPDAIREIVLEVAQVGLPDERKLFTKDFVQAIVSVADDFDTVDLTSHFAASDSLLLHLPFPRVTFGSKAGGTFQEFLWQADKANLDFVDLSDGLTRYAVDDKTMFVYAEPELVGNVTIRSFYVPAVTNLPRQFEGRLVAKLLEKIGITRG